MDFMSYLKALNLFINVLTITTRSPSIHCCGMINLSVSSGLLWMG